MNDITKTIRAMWEENASLQDIRAYLLQFHPYEIAAAIAELPEELRDELYGVFTSKEIAEIVAYVEPEQAADFLEDVANRQVAGVIKEMSADDATDILEHFEDDKRQAVINLLDRETRDDIETLAAYEENEAGSIMSTEFIAIESGKDVKDLMREIVRQAPEADTINTTFVVDAHGHLLGTLDLKKVIVARSPRTVDEIMNPNFRAKNVRDDIEDVIKTIRDYDIDALPLLEDGVLKGIITGDDAMDTFVEEAEEDYARLGGLTESEELFESTFSSVKKRLPWLLALLVMNVFVTFMIIAFDFLFTVGSLTVLAFFQPVILNMAGNSGTQTLAITIQKITKDTLESKGDIAKHLGREAAHGLTLGIAFGLLAFAFSALFLTLDHNPQSFRIAFVVAFSLVVSLTVANFAGAFIPVLFTKLKIDPATASGPFITTVIDIVSLLIYFALATALLYSA
jgi:magnesium transporter